jgi:uncharacterized protein (TIGR02594 family)
MHGSLLDIATRHVGVREIRGSSHNPLVVAMLQRSARWVDDDETPWCGAFVDWCAWLAARVGVKEDGQHPLRARSYLTAGEQSLVMGYASDSPVPAQHVWNTVVALKRSGANQPGPEVLRAPGHVGVYITHDDTRVCLLGGNQRNEVNATWYPRSRVLGARHLGPAGTLSPQTLAGAGDEGGAVT